MCGERLGRVCIDADRYGSSPHVRGTRAGQDQSLSNIRFIPACAGNATVGFAAAHNVPVHPRMCGERLTILQLKLDYLGSSPHVRGTHSQRCPRPSLRRFIPACAGNAGTYTVTMSADKVHPRMCGERAMRRSSLTITSGSSPHVRGTLLACLAGRPVVRFIPACAGNADRGQARPSGTAVHPRMCGERFRSTCGHGSAHRFIPACAGNATWRILQTRSTTVHPRMCGERTSNKLLIYRRKSEPSDSTEHSGC